MTGGSGSLRFGSRETTDVAFIQDVQRRAWKVGEAPQFIAE